MAFDEDGIKTNMESILKKRIIELSQENKVIKEANIKFQIENFKLSKEVKELKSKCELLEDENRIIGRKKVKRKESAEPEEIESDCTDLDAEIPEETLEELDAVKCTFALAQKNGVLSALRLIPKDKSKDSIYVINLLSLFFDKNILIKSSVSGISFKNTYNTKPLDPEKLSVIKFMMLHRLRKQKITVREFLLRYKSTSKHINHRIQNLRKQQRKQLNK